MTKRMTWRTTLVAALLAVTLAGCQTMPASPYSAAQVEALERNGFRADDGN